MVRKVHHACLLCFTFATAPTSAVSDLRVRGLVWHVEYLFELSDFDHHQWCFEKDFQLPAPLTDDKKIMFHFICQTNNVDVGSNK